MINLLLNLFARVFIIIFVIKMINDINDASSIKLCASNSTITMANGFVNVFAKNIIVVTEAIVMTNM